MKKHFLHTENGSSVFWQIEVSGLSLVLSSGKTGFVGKRSIRNFNTRDQCLKEFQKLIDQKTKLGFQESDQIPSFKTLTGKANYLETWKSIVNASEPKEALRSHFQFLTETEECKELLDKIVSKIDQIYIENDQFVFTLPWHHDEETAVHIRWNAPYLGNIHSSVPYSLAKFVSNFNGVGFHHDNDDFATLSIQGVSAYGENRPARIVGDGGWEEEILEEGDDWWINPLVVVEKDYGDVQSFGAFDESQNWYVFHPFIKNKLGEPAIASVYHGSCEMEGEIVRFGMGGFILREIGSWILNIRGYDLEKDLSLSGGPVLTKKFQEFMAKKAVALSENHPIIAKRLLEYDWHSLSSWIHNTISDWVKSLQNSVKENILVIDTYWDDAGEIIFLGFDWHSGIDYDEAMSEGANEIEYILDFTSFYKTVLGTTFIEELNGDEVIGILEDDYAITRDILAYLSVENLISIVNGKEFQKLPRDEEGLYVAYSHYHDEEAEVAYHSSEKEIKSEFIKSLFSADEKGKPVEEISESEQEILDDITGDVLEDYPWVWKSSIEKSINRLAANFQENKERYQREFNKILEYKDKASSDEEEMTLMNLGMQMSSAALNRFLRENKPDLAGWVLHCYNEIYQTLGISRNSTLKGNETGTSYNTAEYFSGDIIVFIAKYGGGKYLPLLEDLLPSDIQDARLAFNLACLNSLEKKKDNLLRYTKLALSLGKPKKDFQDSDFDNFRDDAEFHSLVALH
ncbi:WGR domain-containing protein [Leptospira sp. FAT2]|uniref:WGR domain-containing protein n=1 Tax=Leptospira sanjuanensis TaxID=2879643 RepID=UPI001EE7C092|nr:WGR domain-containing protein [Leptospira sanjuanensis]MCG6194593.1 WGR domain-containing protein [Leptospira sanjuanensis]